MTCMDWLHPRCFSRGEKIWILAFGAALAALSMTPYLAFYAMKPPGMAYMWASVFYYDDYFQYYAWARHIAAGDWLIRNYYTANADASFALFNPYFLALGWATRWLGSPFAAHHVLRCVGVLVFAYVSYAFAALFLGTPRLRRAAQLLALAGGLEFPWFLLTVYVDFLPLRNASPLADPYVYKILYRLGHLTAALCLMLVIFGNHAATAERAGGRRPEGKFRFAIVQALLTLVLALINPYYLVLSVSAVGAHAAYLFARRRSAVALYGFAGMLAGGGGAYLHYAAQPVSARLGSIRFDDPIGLLDYLLFFAVLLPCALAGWRAIAKGETRDGVRVDATTFVAVWTLVAFAFVFIPLRFHARMMFGGTLALAIPAAAWLGRRSFLAPRYWPLYLLMLVDLGFTFAKETLDYRQKGIGLLDPGRIEAFAWLDENAPPGSVVLTSGDTGKYLPAFARVRTWIGHSFQTENYADKQQRMIAFFRRMGDAERTEFLRETGADYVLVGPLERGDWKPGAWLSWPAAYNRWGYAIYRNPQARRIE